MPGFLNAERWIGEENPKIAVATYDLATHAVMYSPHYQAIGGANASVWTKRITAIVKRIMRFEGEQFVPGDVTAPAEANALLAATIDVDPAMEHEFNEWYNRSTCRNSVPCRACWRSPVPGGGHRVERKYLALYHLTSADVTRSPAWSKAANTPWTEKMRPHFRQPLILRCNKYVRKG